jgi:HEAT repeat protein
MTKSKTSTGVAITKEELTQMSASVVPEAGRGLRDPEMMVRVLCLESIHLGAVLLGGEVPDPPAGQVFPPAGRKPSAEEQAEVERYRDDVEKERALLMPLVRALDAEAVPVGQTLSDPVPEVRYLAAKTLEEMGYARQRLRHRAESVPGERPKSEESRRPTDSPKIILVGATELIAQKKEEPRADTVRQDLLRPGLSAVLPMLAARYSDPNVRVRIAAADAIEPLGPLAAPIVPTIARRGLTDPELFVRWASARVLSKIGPVDTALTVPLLAQLLCDPDLDVRMAAAATLGSFGPESRAAVPALAAAATSGDAEQRIAAIHALQGIGRVADSAVPALAAALSDRDVRVRRAAAEALGPLGSAAASAIPALQKALFDVDDSVRKAASDALLSITAER